MLDKSSQVMLRKLAASLCEARHMAEELSQDLAMDACETKNQHIEDALHELAEEIADYAEELTHIEGKIDDLIAPYDKEIA